MNFATPYRKTFPGKVRGTADPSTARRDRSASLGACDFFDLACSLWLESSEEHLPTSIAGVLRLRAISRPLCDRSARRFAQDDGFVGGEKHPVSYAENTKRSKKSQALLMNKRRVLCRTSGARPPAYRPSPSGLG